MIENPDLNAQRATIQDDQIVIVSNAWICNEVTYRPLRFLTGVVNGIISVTLFQVIGPRERSSATSITDPRRSSSPCR
jgi:hypothetical protein